MAKTHLTDEEKTQIIDALNQDTEPPPELMSKLFPHVAEKYDVAALDRAKIATLEYAGKRSEAAILNQTSSVESGSPLQVERCFEKGSPSGQTQLDLVAYMQKEKTDWMNLIVQGDNLQFLKTCYQNEDPLIKDKVKGKVKLVYIDPPFATKSDFVAKEGEDSYSDKIDRAEFIEGLRERFVYIRELLHPEASLYLHLDYRMNHYVRVLLDEILGRANFMSEIIWKRTSAHSDAKNYGNVHDIILFYTKSQSYIFNAQYTDYSIDHKMKRYRHKDSDGRLFTDGDLVATGLKGGGYKYNWKGMTKEWRCPLETMERYEKENRLYYTKAGLPRIKRYLDEVKGNPVADTWVNIFPVNSQAAERVNYPTQKPEALLERIISASSNPGDLVMDVFAGSGTTAAVAEKLGRRWIACDFGKHAIYTMQKRMLRIGESKALGKDVSANQKYEKSPQPFCIVSCGAYDFSRIMNLRENKDAYINFVLGLFKLPRDAKNLNGKYKLANIYGEKDGEPVEVYPVWEDEYLKNIRIDEDYLQQIIIQSGGRLKGAYYIITPETCTIIGDTTLKNSSGDDVHFKLLKFPYKILEEVSRNFQIIEQPNAQENVNSLINATGFYFNDEVEIKVKKIKDGLKITRFKTGILDKTGNKYTGLDGLAMLLVDVDYDDHIFDIEKTIFAKDISDNQEVRISGLTNSVAVIAVDKHGNESAPFIFKD